MFGTGQQQSGGASFGATNTSAPSFAFGQQPSSGSAPTFGQPAAATAFGQQAPGGMAPTFSGAFGGAPGPSTFAAGSSGNAPAASRRRVALRRKR